MLVEREIKASANLRRLCAGLLTVAGLFFLCASAKVTSSSEQALRERAEQLYGALQRGDWRHAEKYLTKDSRAVFRNLPKKPVTAFEIQSAKLDANGETGVVVVQIPVLTNSALGPIHVPETTHWQLIDGSWYLQLSSSDPTERPPGIAGTRPPGLSSPPPGSSPPPPLRSKDLKFESTRVSVGYVHAGEAKVARFAFTNVGPRAETVSIGQASCDCLRMKNQQREFKAGEAGAIELELDTPALKVETPQPLTLTVMLATEPEHALTELTILSVVTPNSGEGSSPSVPPSSSSPVKP